jgi:hypothetical protein
LYSAAIALLNAGSSWGAAVMDYWAKAPLGRDQTLLTELAPLQAEALRLL